MNGERDLHRIASMYYIEEKTMGAIARDLDVSSSTVSRLLKEAREEGVVRISVDRPRNANADLAASIFHRYKVRTYIAPVRVDASERQRLEQVAKVAARVISGRLTHDTTLALGWGTTISAVAEHLPHQPIGDIRIVQLNGAANTYGSGLVHANSVISTFAHAFDASLYYFPVPAFFDFQESKRQLWKESSIQRVVQLGQEADIAAFGVGAITTGSSQVYSAGYLTTSEISELVADEVVGDVCTHFLRADGSYRSIEINKRASGPSPEELRKIPIRICIAAGEHKISAVRAALAAGTATDLVIDESIAKNLANAPGA